MVDRLSEQFARYEAFLEIGGTQACEQVKIVEVGGFCRVIGLLYQGHRTVLACFKGKRERPWKWVRP